MVCYNCESHKMRATKIPSECLWHEKWPVWGFVGIESGESSYDFQMSCMYTCSVIECFIRFL